MATVLKYRGEDIPIVISLTDANGSAINIDDLAELYVYLIKRKMPVATKMFSKAGGGSYTALTKQDAYNYRADWFSSETKSATP